MSLINKFSSPKVMNSNMEDSPAPKLMSQKDIVAARIDEVQELHRQNLILVIRNLGGVAGGGESLKEIQTILDNTVAQVNEALDQRKADLRDTIEKLGGTVEKGATVTQLRATMDAVVANIVKLIDEDDDDEELTPTGPKTPQAPSKPVAPTKK